MSARQQTFEQRISALEQQNAILSDRVSLLQHELDALQGWKTPEQAARLLECSAQTIRKKIRDRDAVEGLHWRWLGEKRYQINVARWKELLIKR